MNSLCSRDSLPLHVSDASRYGVAVYCIQVAADESLNESSDDIWRQRLSNQLHLTNAVSSTQVRLVSAEMPSAISRPSH